MFVPFSHVIEVMMIGGNQFVAPTPGREEGRVEGREEGETALFIKMLELKFGPLPQWAKERIARADAKTIEAWAANLFKAETLEAVFESTS